MKEKVELNNKTILVTGAAGFIGSFLCKRLLSILICFLQIFVKDY